jgi:DNA polymerase I-like protein with 3'-5' exonuclease and polymerase domains
MLVVDIETKDPNLEKLGPGNLRGDGHILGVGIGAGDFFEYYNLGHYNCLPEEREKNRAYLKEQLSAPIPKLGARFQYDAGWLDSDGLTPAGDWHDVQVAEALLDENQGTYNLDFLGQKYLNRGKAKSKIDDFCAQNNLKGDPRKWLWKMPHQLVRDYVLEDLHLPMEIFHAYQKDELVDQNLWDLYRLECDLLKCLQHFRKTGTLIDTNIRDRNAFRLQCEMEESQVILREKYGFDGNVKSPTQVADLLQENGYTLATTDKGNPSVSDDYLKGMEDEHELHRLIRRVRKSHTALNNFLLGSLVNHLGPDGLLHCEFYSTRNDKYGTRSGRFSSATPNLQQIPAIGVDEFFGTMSREPFVPFEGCLWGKIDWSQIEYRFTAHFASGPGSEELVRRYNENPDQDYHQFIMDLTGLKRRFAKNLNFGVAYGMGAKKMARFFGWPLDYCYDILNTYHAKAPYVKHTSQMVERVALRRGYIKTFLNRRSRLVDRSKAYTMFCRLIQGSAADLMKKAMLDAYQGGIFDALYPHITVHDELDVSVPRTREGFEAFRELHHIMENCITIKVPIRADPSLSENWAAAEADENKVSDWEVARARVYDERETA